MSAHVTMSLAEAAERRLVNLGVPVPSFEPSHKGELVNVARREKRAIRRHLKLSGRQWVRWRKSQRRGTVRTVEQLRASDGVSP
jgi:hypothetical protein